MEVKLEKIPNTKGHKLIITFADGKEIYTTIKGNVSESTIKNYEIAWHYVATVEDQITLFTHPCGVIYLHLPPNIYWDIYKRIPSGKTLINNYHYQDNEGNIYALPTTDMYFNSTFASLNGGTGVYGIYSKGELIYIGYTANGYEGRWDQHRQGFARHTNQQPMYRKYDIATIEFKPLVSEEDLQEVLGTDSPIDPELFQIIEYSLIKVLQPCENKEGNTMSYHIKLISCGAYGIPSKFSVVQAMKDWFLNKRDAINGHLITWDDLMDDDSED